MDIIKKSISIFVICTLFIVSACGNISENDSEKALDGNNKAFMQALALEEVGIPGDQPLTKCWAEAGDSCCYASHGKCTTMMGRVTCSEVASDGTVTPGHESSGDGCAALASEYANME